ncbi:MAG: N-acetyltransferase family protein [Pseudomonadota bacterium]
MDMVLMEQTTISNKNDKYIIRKAMLNDAAGVVAVFNYYVENGFAALTEEKMDEDFFGLLRAVTRGPSFYVAAADDGRIVGFGLLKVFNPDAVFDRTGEVAYFVLPDHTGNGLGFRLLEVLKQDALAYGEDTLLARISSLNPPSIRFHERSGFVECGRFRNAGKKKGRNFDLIWMQRFI